MTKIRIMPDNWSYADFLAFSDAMERNQMQRVYELVEQVLVSWDYEEDLSKPGALLRLGVAESAAVVRTVFNLLNTFVADIDTEGVTVDFTVWDTRRFLLFDKIRQEKNAAKTVEMVQEIAKIDGLKGEPNFPQTMRMLMAVNKAYSDLMTGKN